MIMLFVSFYAKNKVEVLAQSISIFIAVLFVVLIGAITDYSKEKKFRNLFSNDEKKTVKCIRNGIIMKIYTEDIVVGDIL
jgi:magnesium-transporting ATPase (P-type)